MIRRAWAPVPADAGRCFVYGPRLGRLYLLRADEAADPVLLRALGLAGWEPRPALTDPVVAVVAQRGSDTADPAETAPRHLRTLYRLLHLSRHLVPFPAAAHLVSRALRRRAPASALDLTQIARLLHGTEQATGLSDCYPRALLTAALASASGHAWDLLIGCLAPTRKMHAWCSVGGQLPYEAAAEHYLYQPLIRLSHAP